MIAGLCIVVALVWLVCACFVILLGLCDCAFLVGLIVLFWGIRFIVNGLMTSLLDYAGVVCYVHGWFVVWVCYLLALILVFDCDYWLLLCVLCGLWLAGCGVGYSVCVLILAVRFWLECLFCVVLGLYCVRCYILLMDALGCSNFGCLDCVGVVVLVYIWLVGDL